MSASCYQDLLRHVGHNVEVVEYAGLNVAVECTECNEILMDFDRYSEDGYEDMPE
jgi:hypothetical protein